MRHKPRNTFTIDSSVVRALRDFSKTNGIPMSRIVEDGSRKEIERLKRIFARF